MSVLSADIATHISNSTSAANSRHMTFAKSDLVRQPTTTISAPYGLTAFVPRIRNQAKPKLFMIR